ncbi:MAG: hypothetical protein LBM59_02710 [Ruminococcus sp.]|jgi:hypothetical protein|nr:hypothetical protein [Ruminococcus sp.]
MKRLLILALIITLSLAACDVSEAETATGSTTETTAAASSPAEETTTPPAETYALPTVVLEEVAEEAVPEETVTTETEVATTAETTIKAEPAVCGTYRTVVPIDDVDPASIPPEEEMFFYSYINVDQMDDGHFQVEFRDPYGGSDESYAVFDTEALGSSQIINFSFDGSGPTANSSSGGAVTITADGDTAWVTFGDGEPEEYRRTE